MTHCIGNDVVDLAAAHNRDRARRLRFLERTLTAAERGRLSPGTDADREFARLWSAKEAAYKALRKRDPSFVFAPRRWQVELGSTQSRTGEREGSVTVSADLRVAVRWRQMDDWVHCVALVGQPPLVVDEAVAQAAGLEGGEPFSEREREGFSCAESAAVRSLAKRLLRRHGAGSVEIVRAPDGHVRAPPRAYSGAMPLAGVDLSLSHDGRFVAAVIALATGGDRTDVSARA
ncbi:MAG: 4'-phosphopantetheinyl transferase superfamily protein [Proteobacteria bacterium]|nr:4'-phosphopantetheinyl transferase superfamily protein [Pseudomonadota bacterium]